MTAVLENTETDLGGPAFNCSGEGNGRLSEEEIYKLLDRIHQRTSKANLLVFYYRCQALFTEQLDKDKFTIKDGYMKLRQHGDFYRTALSLVLYMLEECGSKEETDTLQKHVESSRTFESDFILQRLNLWKMLTDIASRLSESEDDVRNLVTVVGSETDTNTDHIIVNGQYLLPSALEAFWLLEKVGKLKPMLKDHPRELRKGLCLFNILLSRLSKVKLVNEYIEYNPNQPLTLAVLEVERMEAPDSTHQLQGIPTPEQLQLAAFTGYKKSLTDTYKRMLIIESGQWPPVKEHFYINLALITPDFIPRSDTFSRETIRGSVDDIYKRKESIAFGDVFPDQVASKKHYVSLIEGRPGCGKSTLITKVSKDWAEEAILKDIELFVLVRLRRFVGQKSLTLKDLLGIYCPDPEIVDAINKKITRDGGKGVCFAFDGLDEYSAHLVEGNLIMNIIYGYQLPHAAVFLTSRPATSERFRQKTLLTKNIEIIGFLEEEIKSYVNSYYKDDDGKAYGLMKYIKDHPNIERMCYLPLHIAMIAYLYDIDPQLLPLTETELYYKFTLHTLYRSMKKNLGDQDMDDIELEDFSDLKPDQRKIFENICKLAFKATLEQKQLFTGREIKKLADLPEIPQKREFNSVGLLTVDRMISQRSALPTKTFSFLHLTHQEFLAAVHIVDHLSESEALEIVQEHGEKVHMWVVWKFLCGIHARNSEDSMSGNDTFNKTFQRLITKNVSTRLACLNMVHCAFESQSQASCLALLSLLNGVIDVMDVALNPSDCSALGYVLASACGESKEIDFSYCHLGPRGLAAFVQQLGASQGDLTKVNTLRLRARTDYKPVGSEGAYDLIKLLGKLPNLGELRLYGNKVKTGVFEHLAPAIARLGQIHTLILSRNDLEVRTGPLMSDVLGSLSLLHTFYISYNPLTEVGLGAMKPGLLKCKKLEILGLRGTSLGEGAGVHLSDIFGALTNLDVVELYQNKLGDKGVCDMKPGLLKSQSLRSLSLVENNISDAGAIKLVEYLSTTNSLQQIRIYYNHEMTDVGKIALRTAVVERPEHFCSVGSGLAV